MLNNQRLSEALLSAPASLAGSGDGGMLPLWGTALRPRPRRSRAAATSPRPGRT